MSNPWFRMYAEFATDPKVQMLPEAMQRRFIMLLCVRCNGDVTLHDEEVTFLLRITETEWRETKALFIAKNFIDETNNLLNWDKRQFRSDSSSERVARHRANKKQEPVTECNVTVTPPDTEQIQNRTDTEKKERVVRVSRGTRLPSDWELPQEWGDWAETQGLSGDEIFFQADKFKDWWASKAGSGGAKSDWLATWRNWIRNYLERKPHVIQAKKFK